MSTCGTAHSEETGKKVFLLLFLQKKKRFSLSMSDVRRLDGVGVGLDELKA